MTNKLILIIIIASLFVQISAYGEPLKATIWIPEKLLLNQQYYGIIVVDQELESDVAFDVITDNDEVIQILTENVVIPKAKHHGIITLQTKGTGDAQIYGIYKDTLLKQDLEVVESAATPTKLDLITPSSIVDVLSGNNAIHTGYVFLLNDFDNPVVAKEPVTVALTSNGDIILAKNSVTINAGSHYAKFSFETKGEGSLSASAANLEPDDADISVSDPSEIELRMEVAPSPIPTSSSAEIYYWLERDGKPYIPTHDIKITITIDKSTNLSFDAVIKGAIVLSSSTTDRQATNPDAKKVITRSDAQLERDSTKEFILQKGSHYGKATVYSSFDETDSININGLAESINPPKDEEIVRVTDTLIIDTEKTNSKRATETDVFALPNPAYDKVEIIVSSRSDEGPVLEQDDESFTVFIDNKLSLELQSGTIKADENYGILTATVKDIGSSKIFGQRNEAEGEEIEIEVETKYVRDPEIEIVTLPVIFGVNQDLFLISSSQDKIITNPDMTDGNLISITSRPAFEYDVVNDNTSVVTVRGKVTNLLEEDPVVHVASNAFTATETLDVYNPNRNKIDSMHPPTVYAGEPFPIVNHITDLDDNPMRMAELKVSSGVEMGRIGDLVYFNESGTHGIIFYDKNTVPVESTITIAGSAPQPQIQQVEQDVQQESVFTYTINVIDGQGSGTYPEGSNVTISAPAVIDDMYIIKKKLVGWENLPYKEATVTFEADFDVETRPIYQQDFTMLLMAGGGAAGIGAVITINKKKKKNKKDDDISEENKIIDELLEK
ncbi:MAG TPA: hypothetical protein VNK25_02220 [Candidatus Nitrosotenuis sp.]|nr:hypothetical protein [Candidatus Nitrosotenuis sp.]